MGKQEETVAPPRKLKLTYDEYCNICSSIVLYMSRRHNAENGGKFSRKELVQYYTDYLESKNKISGVESLKQHINLLKVVLERMAQIDSILIQSSKEKDLLFELHPNLDVDNMFENGLVNVKRVEDSVDNNRMRKQMKHKRERQP